MQFSESCYITKLRKLDDWLLFWSVFEQVVHEGIGLKPISDGIYRKVCLIDLNFNRKISFILSFILL